VCPETAKNKYAVVTRPALHLVILALLASLLFFYNLGGWDLWNPDEPRYAQIAHEMAEDGNWILPRHNNRIYPDKPPVFFWLIALSYAVSGEVNSFAARFPSALAGVLGVILTYLIGRRLKSPRAGFISALVLATTVEYFWLGRRVNLDMTLTLFILGALFFFYKGYLDNASRLYYISYFFIGLATLTKGPVGFILPLLTIIIYVAFKKGRQGVKAIIFHPGLMLFFALIFAWLIPSAMVGGKEYLDEIIFKQMFGRVYESWSHKEPFYYYFLNFPALVIPWILFLPSAFIYGFSRTRRTGKEDVLLPMVWFITVFVFFTLCSGKRPLYLLPLIPAFALMVGLLWDRFFDQDGEAFVARLVRVPCYLMLGALIAACIAVPWLSESFKSKYSLTVNFYLPALIVGVCAIAALTMFVKRRTALTFTMLIAIMAGGFVYSSQYVFPAFNEFNSAKPFSLKIKSLLKEGDLLASFCQKNDAFIFYSGVREIKELETPSAMATLFMKSSQRVFCLMYKRDFGRIASVLPFRIYPWEEGRVEDREFIIVSNHERS
jgi:4-amino-4-deoxy-L-arabinose transferase-like glycosyltransferase